MTLPTVQHDEHAPLTYGNAARFLNNVTLRMRDAEKELKVAGDLADDLELLLTKEEHLAFSIVEGKTADERKAAVKAAVADRAFEFSQAKRRVKIAEKAIARLEREASITTFLGRWAQSERGSLT